MRILKYFFGIFFIGVLVLLIYCLYSVAPTSLSDDKITFVVPVDSTQDDLVKKLHDDGLIRSPSFFRLLSSFFKYPGKIEPGSYQLSHRMSTIRIANTLMLHPYQLWITLVPGLRREQVAERLAKKFYWQDDKLKDFLATAKEGYLFPDTYLLNLDYTGKEFAERLMNTFNEQFTDQMYEDMTAKNIRLETTVKIASLIERESGGDEDKALIAGVIWNRLLKPMRLQIDATSQYIKGKSGDWWPIVRPEDHQVESPYNTYLTSGLPPTPIANPSLASLKAAIYSADTDCFFYLHDSNKQIHCSRDYEGHLENIETYLR